MDYCTDPSSSDPIPGCSAYKVLKKEVSPAAALCSMHATWDARVAAGAALAVEAWDRNSGVCTHWCCCLQQPCPMPSHKTATRSHFV